MTTKLVHGALAIAMALGHGQATPIDQRQQPNSVNPGPGSANSNVQTSGSIWPWQSYMSSSLLPPNLTITGNGRALSPGYAFFAPKDFGALAGGTPGAKQQGGFVMDQANQLVYGTNDSSVDDLHVQRYNGKDYLTYFYLDQTNATTAGGGHGYGSFKMLDSSYNLAYDLCIDLGLYSSATGKPKCQFDAHEQHITARNTLLVTGYNYTTADLSSVNASAHSYILDSHIFEIDIETQKVLFSWKASDHVPFTESNLAFSAMSNGSAAAPWDWFHVNSIDMVGDNFLINSRHCWSTYLVSSKDGSVIWRIDGADGGDFGSLPEGGNFSWEHFVRAHNVSDSSITLSYFANNNAGSGPQTPTRGLALQLSLPPSKSVSPKLLRKLEVPSEELYAGSQGLYQVDVGAGNQFMGYGQIAVMREYGPATDGSDVRWEARFGADNEVVSYRSYKQEWCGTPTAWDPALVVSTEGSSSNGTASGFVSWNGATDVKSWEVFNGKDKNSMASVGKVPFKGFETKFNAPAKGCVQVTAIMASGSRKSNMVCN